MVDKSRFSLPEWEHAKLLTGFAVEKLMANGESGNLIDDRNNLKAAPYGRISPPLRPAGPGHTEASAKEGRCEGLM